MLLRIVRGTVVLACTVALTLAVMPLDPAPTLVFAQDDGSALSLVKEGLREYKKGNYKTAIEKFDQALAKSPNDDDARKIRDEVSVELTMDLIKNNFADSTLSGRYTRFGKWVVAGRQKDAAKGRNNNPDEIKQYVDAYMGDSDTSRNLLRAARIRDAYGDFIVPYVQANFMHSDNQDSRFRARVLLSTVGAQAVTALEQVMQSSQAYDRQTAALALSDIGDPRALPVLAAHFQDSAEDEGVREACRHGIEGIRKANPEKDKQVENARDLYFLQAEGYYRNNAAGRYFRNRLVGASYAGNLPVVMYGHDRTYTVWRWMKEAETEKLVPREVPLWAYADLLAEESAMQGIGLGVKQNDPKVMQSRALLSCVHFHLYGEAMSRMYGDAPDPAERDFINGLLAEDGVVSTVVGAALGASAGSATLYAALQRSLADGYPEVSIAICGAIADLGDRSMIGPASVPLFAALKDTDKRISYAAACTFVKLGANKDFGNNRDVEEVIAHNLQETAARSVLVIAEDEALRNRYLIDIESLGIGATGANSLEEGADKATQAPVYDAIIVQGSLILAPVNTWEPPAIAGRDRAGETRMETLLDILKGDIRTKQIPLLVACRDDDVAGRKAALAGKSIPDSQFITYSAEYVTDSTSLGETMKSIWDANPESAKNRANRMVSDMAGALGKLDPAATKYNVEKLLGALAGGLRLSGRDSQARASICTAIGALVADSTRVGAAWVRQNVVATLIDTVNSTELVDSPKVKAAAARALGSCYAAHKGCFDEDGLKALIAMMRLRYDVASVDAKLKDSVLADVADARKAAGEALGRSPATDAQRAEALKAQAVVPHEKPPEIPAGK